MDPGKKWFLLGLTVLMQTFVIGVCIYSFTFFVVPWMEAFAVQRSVLMLAVTVAAITTGVLTPGGGLLIDRFQAKHLCLFGMVVFGAALLLASVATSPTLVIVAFGLVMPIAVIFAGPLMCQAAVARAFDEKRGVALGLCAIGTSVGGFFLPLLVTNLMPVMGWRMVLRLVAVLSFVTALPIILWVFGGKKVAPGVAARESAPAHKPLDLRLLRNGDVLRLAVIFVVPACLYVSVLHNLGALAKDLAVSIQAAGLIVSTASFFQAVSKIALGGLADRFQHLYLYVLVMVMIVVGILSTALADSLPVLFFGVILLACAAGGMVPLVGLMAVERFGQERLGTVLGAVYAIGALSGLPPLVASFVRELSGTYRTAFLALTPLIALSIYCYLRFYKSGKATEAVASAVLAPPA